MSISKLEAGITSFSAIQQDRVGAFKNLLAPSNPVDVKEVTAERPDYVKDLKITGIDSTPPDNEDQIQLKLVDVYGQAINTSGFEQFINHIELNQEQASTVQNALLAVSQTEDSSQTQGDTYGMRISQVNLELKYISANLVPAEYQDKFNSFADDYTQQLSNHYVDYLKKFATELAGRTDSVANMTGWPKQGKKMLDSLQNGSSDFQVSAQRYQSLYSTVDVTNPDTVKRQLDSVYKTILSGSGAYSGSSALVEEVRNLSAGWNRLMDVLGDQRNKLTTAIDQLA